MKPKSTTSILIAVGVAAVLVLALTGSAAQTTAYRDERVEFAEVTERGGDVAPPPRSGVGRHYVTVRDADVDDQTFEVYPAAGDDGQDIRSLQRLHEVGKWLNSEEGRAFVEGADDKGASDAADTTAAPEPNLTITLPGTTNVAAGTNLTVAVDTDSGDSRLMTFGDRNAHNVEINLTAFGDRNAHNVEINVTVRDVDGNTTSESVTVEGFGDRDVHNVEINVTAFGEMDVNNVEIKGNVSNLVTNVAAGTNLTVTNVAAGTNLTVTNVAAGTNLTVTNVAAGTNLTVTNVAAGTNLTVTNVAAGTNLTVAVDTDSGGRHLMTFGDRNGHNVEINLTAFAERGINNVEIKGNVSNLMTNVAAGTNLTVTNVAAGTNLTVTNVASGNEIARVSHPVDATIGTDGTVMEVEDEPPEWWAGGNVLLPKWQYEQMRETYQVFREGRLPTEDFVGDDATVHVEVNSRPPSYFMEIHFEDGEITAIRPITRDEFDGDADIVVHAERRAFHRVITAENPSVMAERALATGDIEIAGGSLRAAVATAVSRAERRLTGTEFAVEPGEEKLVEWRGEEATFRGSGHGAYSVSDGGVVLDPEYGDPVGFTTKTTQDLIDANPEGLSPNAGVYRTSDAPALDRHSPIRTGRLTHPTEQINGTEFEVTLPSEP